MSQFYDIGGVFPGRHWSSLVVIGCHWQSLAVIGFQTYPYIPTIIPVDVVQARSGSGI